MAIEEGGRPLTGPLSGPWVLLDHPPRASLPAALDDSPSPKCHCLSAAVATPWIQKETNKGQRQGADGLGFTMRRGEINLPVDGGPKASLGLPPTPGGAGIGGDSDGCFQQLEALGLVPLPHDLCPALVSCELALRQ